VSRAAVISGGPRCDRLSGARASFDRAPGGWPDFYQASAHHARSFDLDEGCAEVVGDGVGGGDDVVAGMNLDGAVTAGDCLLAFVAAVAAVG
jgi:hypothetical protein